MRTTTLNGSLTSRKIRLLKNRQLRNKYIIDQIKIGLRNQLRALRDERGLTQGDLANLIGTKQSVISRLERDPVKVGMSTFLDIARQLDVAFVARFEAIDTFTDWYDNMTQKKMAPSKSETVLAECAKQLADIGILAAQETPQETAVPVSYHTNTGTRLQVVRPTTLLQTLPFDSGVQFGLVLNSTNGATAIQNDPSLTTGENDDMDFIVTAMPNYR